ncbi:MAG: L,D-transpeptidase [Bacteroidales bacterium]|nr:L,D-transpeptidase [Bacteroidales bacterium]
MGNLPGFAPGIFFNMNYPIRPLFILFALSLIIPGIFGFILYQYISNQPPKEEINNAIEIIGTARKIEANTYAKTNFDLAEKAFNLAMREWNTQNERLFILRDYTLLKEAANHAIRYGNEAYTEASYEKDSLSIALYNQLKKVRFQLAKFEKKFKHLPLSNETFNEYAKAKMSYTESNIQFNKKQFYASKQSINIAEKAISSALVESISKLNQFYIDYPIWKKNALKAKELSMNGQYVILVNKLESTCTLLKTGKNVAQFKTEFGTNWLGDKRLRGDNATPEGIYKIVKKKKGGNTNYYKSLLLNYPNEEDKQRFSEAIKNGSIPKHSKIGELIQIHGLGGKGLNWTEGCIALNNEDMETLYNMVQVNTPVIIIGANISLSEYLK